MTRQRRRNLNRIVRSTNLKLALGLELQGCLLGAARLRTIADPISCLQFVPFRPIFRAYFLDPAFLPTKVILMMRRALLVGCLLLCVLGLTGCSRGKRFRVAFVSNNPENFWLLAEAGCQKAEKELGDVAVEFRRPNPATLEEQQKILKNLENTGVQAIAISPNDPQNAVDFLSRLNGKLPILCQDNDVPNKEARRLYLGTHNYQAGRAAGELVKEAMKKANKDGGKVGIFVGDLAASNARERRQGVLDVLAGIDRTELGAETPHEAVNFPLGDGKYVLALTKTDGADAEKCQNQAAAILGRDRDIDVVVGLWAYNPPALLKARPKDSNVIIIGFDEDLETLQAVEDGKIYGTVVQNPVQFGYLSVKLMHGFLTKDDTFRKQQTFDSQERLFIPHRVFKNDGTEPERAKLVAFHQETRNILNRK